MQVSVQSRHFAHRYMLRLGWLFSVTVAFAVVTAVEQEGCKPNVNSHGIEYW